MKLIPYVIILVAAVGLAAIVWRHTDESQRNLLLGVIGLSAPVASVLTHAWQHRKDVRAGAIRRLANSPSVPFWAAAIIAIGGIALASGALATLVASSVSPTRLGLLSHIGSVVVVILLLALLAGSVWYQAKHREQWRSVVDLQKALQESNPWSENNAPAARAEAIANIRDILDNLDGQLDAAIPNFFYRAERQLVKYPRCVSIWVPDTGRNVLRCVAWTPREGCYKSLAKNYHPSLHDPDKWSDFCKQRDLTRPREQKAREEWDRDKRNTTSLLGAVFHGAQPDPTIIDDLTVHQWGDQYYFDHSHESYLSKDKVTIRSCYVRRLLIAERPIGLLVILDPLLSGMYMRNQDFIAAHVYLLETALRRHLHFSRSAGVDPWTNV